MRNYPVDCWYVAATSGEVGRELLGRRLLDQPVVLYRREGGDVVALADRCAHRAYPLSKGRLDGDAVVCGYHGLRYDGTGVCVHAPSQPSPPYGLGVRSYPVREEPPFVWVWLGEPGTSQLRSPPDLSWLSGEGWTSSGSVMRVAANYLGVHEHYVDLTHVPQVHPAETPPGLDRLPALDQVEVSETSATYVRRMPPAPLADWEAEATGLPRDRSYHRRHHGGFLSPALLVEGWEIDAGDDGLHELARVHAVTPESATGTHLFSRFARNFRLESVSVDRYVQQVFEEVMRRDVAVIETIEETAGYEASAQGIRLSADAGVVHVRRIVAAMLAAESGAGTKRPTGRPN